MLTLADAYMLGRESVVCSSCFRDRRLKEFIETEGKRRRCNWCRATVFPAVPLHLLGDIFRDAASTYVPSEGLAGNTLGYLLQDDWQVFSDKLAAVPDRIDDLTCAIIYSVWDDDTAVDWPDYTGQFTGERPWLEEDWIERIEALLQAKSAPPVDNEKPTHPDFDNGCESEEFPEPDHLVLAFDDLVTHIAAGEMYARARIHRYRTAERFNTHDLRAPPADKTPAGRANRSGEPVLYMASSMETAVAEVRPWKGARVAWADFQVARNLSVIDATAEAFPDSPFFDDEIVWRLQVAGLAYRFGTELSSPIAWHEEDTLYQPTQHLCEAVAAAGYDGVLYPSAMGSGSNLVLFNPEDAKPLSVQYVSIDAVSYNVYELSEHAPLFEEGTFDHLIMSL